MATEQSGGAIKGKDGSGDDEEDESKESLSGPPSKSNSLNLSTVTKGPTFTEENAPTTGSLLAQAQAQSTRTISTQAPTMVTPTDDVLEESACRRLITHAFFPHELPSLIEEMFTRKDEVKAIGSLDRDAAQSFIDVVHNVRPAVLHLCGTV